MKTVSLTRLSKLLICLHLLCFAQVVLAADLCEKLFTKSQVAKEIGEASFGGTLIKYFKANTRRHKFKPSELVENHSKNDLYVGISFSHTYLVFNSQRFDGGFLPGMIPSTVHKRSGLLDSGFVLRIRDVPDDIGQRLARHLDQLEFTFSATCSSGVCSLLEKNGIKIEGPANFSPTQMLLNLLTKGIRLESGEELVSELYLVNSKDPNEHTSYASDSTFAITTAMAMVIFPLLISFF